uniref:HMA domain-containing protein n=1 Tax=Leersia perrieri TaxID=77586 RepID=A0A0D9W617_9ORYZ
MGDIEKEIVIRLHSSEKGHKKAIKVAAAVSGVESVTLAGEDRNLLLVIGFSVDSNDLIEKLRRKVGRAEVVELRTVDADELMHPYGGGGYYGAATPYNTHHLATAAASTPTTTPAAGTSAAAARGTISTTTTTRR